MRVLVACEFSGVVRDAFIAAGHTAVSCDILPSESEGPHYQGDIRDLLDGDWDLMIAHPPCTYLANSGVQYLHKDETRWEKMRDGRDFFLTLLNTDIPRIAVENPLPHGYAELPKYSQIIQPYMFGHQTQKRTCLWLKNLPLLEPTKIVDKGEVYVYKGKSNGAKWYHQAAFTPDRWKIRSRTFEGIAQAMAEQWGKEVTQN